LQKNPKSAGQIALFILTNLYLIIELKFCKMTLQNATMLCVHVWMMLNNAFRSASPKFAFLLAAAGDAHLVPALLGCVLH
jgi:hypothetical protein